MFVHTMYTVCTVCSYEYVYVRSCVQKTNIYYRLTLNLIHMYLANYIFTLHKYEDHLFFTVWLGIIAGVLLIIMFISKFVFLC